MPQNGNESFQRHMLWSFLNICMNIAHTLMKRTCFKHYPKLGVVKSSMWSTTSILSLFQNWRNRRLSCHRTSFSFHFETCLNWCDQYKCLATKVYSLHLLLFLQFSLIKLGAFDYFSMHWMVVVRNWFPSFHTIPWLLLRFHLLALDKDAIVLLIFRRYCWVVIHMNCNLCNPSDILQDLKQA